jgi:hypothetical protein
VRRILLLIALALTFPALAQPSCTPIQLPPGQTAITIKGTAKTDPPFTCYTLTTRVGQTASINLVPQSPKDDTAFNIAGIVDNRDKYTFKTEAKTYKIDVYLTFARQPPRPFAMQVSVK